MMRFNLDGAIHWEKLAEMEEVLSICKQVGVTPAEDLAPLEAKIAHAKQLQADCDHKGWARSDCFALACGECGASLYIGR